MRTSALSKKDLVMSLIKDHLVSYRLIRGLEKTGLEADNFDLFIGETIFALMGFGGSDKEESLYMEFLEWSGEVSKIVFDSNHREPLHDLCREIYKKLKSEQKLRKCSKK